MLIRRGSTLRRVDGRQGATPNPTGDHSMKSISVLAIVVAALSACAAPRSPEALAGDRTETCKASSESEIAALFERWNDSLKTGDARQVVANYAEHSILLPTVSNRPRLTPEEKEDYFHHFLEDRPSGRIGMRTIQVGCNTALDAGLYSFTFAKTGAVVAGRYSFTYRWDGSRWLITSHHSSKMPEPAAGVAK